MKVQFCFCFKICLAAAPKVPRNRSAFCLERGRFSPVCSSDVCCWDPWNLHSSAKRPHANTSHVFGRGLSASVNTKRELPSSIQYLLGWKLRPPRLEHPYLFASLSLSSHLFQTLPLLSRLPGNSKVVLLLQGTPCRWRGGYKKRFLKKTAENSCKKSSRYQLKAVSLEDGWQRVKWGSGHSFSSFCLKRNHLFPNLD